MLLNCVTLADKERRIASHVRAQFGVYKERRHQRHASGRIVLRHLHHPAGHTGLRAGQRLPRGTTGVPRRPV